jgi:hypothetical protein
MGAMPVSGAIERSMAISPASITTPESIALIPLGAWVWASGSQVWSGTRALFTPNPATISPPAASRIVLPSAAARISSRSRVPVLSSTRLIPIRTRTEPVAL